MISPVLTIDGRRLFHVCGDAEYADPSTWSARVKRVHVGTERILEALDGYRLEATFFVLGWVARQSPSLVRRIADAGTKSAATATLHRRVFEMTVDEFPRGTLRSARERSRRFSGRG